MASSRRSRHGSARVSADLLAVVSEQLRTIVRTGDHVGIGLSGGIDSMVLLDLLVRLARRRRLRLSAIHVNHQISPNAGRWAAFCRKACRDRGVPLTVVKATVPRGDSLEAAARKARYAAFGRVRVNFLALAHNQDDQAETVLLQLLRGAGVKGLAAMPVERTLRPAASRSGRGRSVDSNSPVLLRPLLQVPRRSILEYAGYRDLDWVEDESNVDAYFARNHLRHEVLPVIERRYPAYRETLGRAARHFAETAELLDALGEMDAGICGVAAGIDLLALRGLSPARAKNVVRWVLARHGVAMPSARRLEETVQQLRSAKRDARIAIDLGGCVLRTFAGAAMLAPVLRPVPARFEREWGGARRIRLSELGGTLLMTPGRAPGIEPGVLGKATVTIRVRRGGERLRLAAGGASRSLKNLFQEQGIPPWLRDRWPLIFCGNRLAAVPGIGVDCNFAALCGHRAIVPRWNPELI